MKDIKFIHLNSKKKYNIFIFKIFIFFIILQYCFFETCNNRDNPYLLNKEECVQSCEGDKINSDLCILDNEIIKTQYLNNIIYVKEGFKYLNLEVSENNNLYYFLSEYPNTNARIFYILNNEGYGLLNKNDPIYNNNINDTSKKGKYESDIFTFKLLSDTDNREYLISISKGSQFIEIYDFYLNKIYFQKAMDFFSLPNIFNIVGTHIKLKNKKNNYIIGLLASNSTNIMNQIHYFYLKKGNFTTLDFSNNQLFDSQKVRTTQAKIISCYETLSNFIICFYQNPDYKYTMIVFDYDLVEKVNVTIAEKTNSIANNDLFFKCIHFFEDTGVFGYFNNDENPLIIFQFKKYIINNNSIIDNYESITQLSINDIYFNHNYVTSSEMIKICDKKFYYLGLSSNQEILYIISIYNYYQENFSTRIYSINIQNLYNYTISSIIKVELYKNFLVFGSKNHINKFMYLIIFSYPNTNETNLDIFDYLYKNDDIKIDNLMLKLKGEYILENNIFGYIYSGIQIIENCNDLEDIYLVDSNNERIANYFLSENEEIKLFIPKNDIYSPFICTLKYASVVSEPEYLEYNKYPIKINYIGEDNKEEEFFDTQKKNYIGKYNYYNIKLSSELSENCEDDCALCDTINNICITCKYSSICKNNSDNTGELTNVSTNIPNNLTNTLNDLTNIPNDSTNIPNNIPTIPNDNISNDLTKQKKSYIEECNSIDFLNNLCKTNNNNNKDKMVKIIESDIENHLLDTLISNIIYGEKKDLIIKDNNTIYQITSSEIQNNKNNTNISKIILGECENILKREYIIDNTKPLIIFKIEYYKPDSLIPIIGYEVFHPENMSKLDLTYCKNEMVNLSIPVTIDEENFFKYDPNDEYYTDQCKPYTTEDGTDILLNDRQNEYNENNLSLCENNCQLDNYDPNSKQVICNCEIKNKQIVISDIANQSDLLYYNFSNNDGTSNTMKCYYTLFTKNGFFTNIANYILLITIIVFLLSIFLFYKFGFHTLEEDIKDLLLLRKKKIKKNKNISNPKEKKKIKDENRKSKSIINKIDININKKNKKMSLNKKMSIFKKMSINKTKLNEKSIRKSSSKIDFIYSNKLKYINNNLISKNTKTTSNKLEFNDFELNTMNYKDALKLDKRKFENYYISLIKTKHPIFFSFYPIKDYNSKIIKIDLFFLSFSIYYSINYLFFDEKVIHNIYKDKGFYNFIFLIPFILYSFIISNILIIVIKYFSLSERDICKIKNISINKSDDLIYKVKRCIIIKYIIFYFLCLLFLFLFWYILSSFGAVYKNTQLYLIKNTLISFAFSLIYPFIINLIPGILRIYSLKNSKRECIYKINNIIQLI